MNCFFTVIFVFSITLGNAQASNHNNIINPNQLIIEAVDLTEDVSSVSSNNDEVLVFIYSDSTASKNLIYKKSIILDHKNYTTSIVLPDSVSDKKLIVVLIEQDTRSNIDQIVKILSGNIKELKLARENNDAQFIDKILQDDDLIGICEFDSLQEKLMINKTLKGIQMFDAFEYRIERR